MDRTGILPGMSGETQQEQIYPRLFADGSISKTRNNKDLASDYRITPTRKDISNTP
jgi:hypothetical protein